jgi:hypothetical protein
MGCLTRGFIEGKAGSNDQESASGFSFRILGSMGNPSVATLTRTHLSPPRQHNEECTCVDSSREIPFGTVLPANLRAARREEAATTEPSMKAPKLLCGFHEVVFC